MAQCFCKTTQTKNGVPVGDIDPGPEKRDTEEIEKHHQDEKKAPAGTAPDHSAANDRSVEPVGYECVRDFPVPGHYGEGGL